MSKETFTWTDELIKEMLYRHFPFGPEFIPLQNTLDNFKQSKMPKKEWEVIEVISRKGGKLTKQRNEISWEQWGLKSFYGLKINAVKRSDGEVFTVGDEVTRTNRDKLFEIVGFSIRGNVMIAALGSGGYEDFISELHHSKKLPPQSKPEQPKKDRIEVMHMSTGADTVILYCSNDIPQGKYQAMKEAIDKIINDEMDDIKCKCLQSEKHGETSIMCCNHCGLPTEKFWTTK